MRRLLVISMLLAALLPAAAVAAVPAWTTYRHDGAHSGIDPNSSSPVTPTQVWQTPALDGEVYAQPLVYGSYVYVATESDTVYALNAATGAVVWSAHLGTPEPASAAPCGDISPSIGITSTPVIDTTTKRIYAVGAVSNAGVIHHELFAVDLSSGAEASGFPINVDPSFPSGGSAVNQLQRAGLALDDGRILIGYGGNDDDCATYWGWLVSVPLSGTGALKSFQADSSYHEGALWGSGNAPVIDGSGYAYIATGNGGGDTSSNPDYGDSVVKLNASASALDWWAPPDWKTLDSSDGDLGSSMPTLLPGGYLFESGKDGNGYLLSEGHLGNVSSPLAEASGFCGGGSYGGSVYDRNDSTIYATCAGGLKALTLGAGPSLAKKAGFAAPAGATGPPMIAGGLVWVASSHGDLYGLDPLSGTANAHFSIPENGSEVNHFASPSAGGGRLFVGSGNQVTAYAIGVASGLKPTVSALKIAPRRVSIAGRVVAGRCVKPTTHNEIRARCRLAVKLRVTYKLNEPAKVTFTLARQARGRKVRRACVKPTAKNRRHPRCGRWVGGNGSIAHAGRTGTNAFTFPGAIGGRRLVAGFYRLVATPTGGSPRTVTFRLVG